jgi:hypothetical protein
MIINYHANRFETIFRNLVYIDSNNWSKKSLNHIKLFMFLDNGQTIVLISSGNKSFVFFNRSSHTNLLISVNDLFFYVTSRVNQAIYSHSSNKISWLRTEEFVFNVSAITRARRVRVRVWKILLIGPEAKKFSTNNNLFRIFLNYW